jgi:hypothetical protein
MSLFNNWDLLEKLKNSGVNSEGVMNNQDPYSALGGGLINPNPDPYQFQYKPLPMPEVNATPTEQPKTGWQKAGDFIKNNAGALISGWGLLSGNEDVASPALNRYNQIQDEQRQNEEENERKKMQQEQFKMQTDQYNWNRLNQDAEYITIDENMLAQIPEQYRGYFQPGQRIKRDELMKMIPVSEPVDPLDVEYKKSQIFKNYQTGDNDSDRGNIDLSRQYKDIVEGGYDQYLTNTKARNDIRDNPQQPLRFNDWIRQPENKDALLVYNQYNNGNLQSLTSRLSTKEPGQNNQKTVKSKTGQSIGYNQNNEYSENDWWTADKLVSDKKSFNKALTDAMKDQSVPDSVIRALTDRYNRINKTKLSPEQLYARLTGGKSEPPKGGVKLAKR